MIERTQRSLTSRRGFLRALGLVASAGLIQACAPTAPAPSKPAEPAKPAEAAKPAETASPGRHHRAGRRRASQAGRGREASRGRQAGRPDRAGRRQARRHPRGRLGLRPWRPRQQPRSRRRHPDPAPHGLRPDRGARHLGQGRFPAVRAGPGDVLGGLAGREGVHLQAPARASSSTTARPVDAEAIKFNIERNWNPNHPFYHKAGAGANALGYKDLDKVEVVDASTVRVTHKAPFADFLNVLAFGTYSIGSPTQIQKVGNDEFGNQPVGSGPFKFVERERGVKLVFEQQSGVLGRRASPGRFIIRPLPEAVARLTALETGEVDWVNNVHPDSIEKVRANPNLVIELAQLPNTWGYIPNHRAEPTKNVKVRQALNWAVNREALGEGHHEGPGRHLDQPVRADRHGRPQPEHQGVQLRSGQGEGAAGRGRLRQRPGAALPDPAGRGRLAVRRPDERVPPAELQGRRHQRQDRGARSPGDAAEPLERHAGRRPRLQRRVQRGRDGEPPAPLPLRPGPAERQHQPRLDRERRSWTPCSRRRWRPPTRRSGRRSTSRSSSGPWTWRPGSGWSTRRAREPGARRSRAS